MNPLQPSDFIPLASEAPGGCGGGCHDADKLGFQFDYAYQPIVDVSARSIFAHEALVRGPNGEGAMTLLADFTPNLVKLDMALVRGVSTSRSRQAITRGVVRMCRELDIEVVAEGVETADERDFFLHEGVRLMQGYLFARPTFRGHVPASAVASWAAG